MKKVLKVLGVIFAAILLIALGIYQFVLQYPNLNENPTIGKWYRVTTCEMKTSEGGKYRAFFKKRQRKQGHGIFRGRRCQRQRGNGQK